MVNWQWLLPVTVEQNIEYFNENNKYNVCYFQRNSFSYTYFIK